MPIYEYRCGKCGAKFEQLTTWAKADQVPCPHCQSEKTKRLLSTFGVAAKAGDGSFGAGGDAEGPCSHCTHDSCPYNDD